MKIRRASGSAVNAALEPETAFTLRRATSSRRDLLTRLDRAHKTIKILEKRVAMQEKTYMVAMQEKNRTIRELQSQLQGK